MKKIYLLLLLSLIILSECGPRSANSGTDLTETVYSPEYASGFEIKGADGKESVMLDISNPWQGADSVSSRLFIARGGESAPSGFDGQVLEGEARRIVAMSSTHVAMLAALDASDRIAGVSGIDYITDPEIQRRRGEIADVGYEGNIDFEALVGADPDLVLLYGVSGASSMEGKLRELGIPYVYIGDYLEESPLGKAEWIVALAEITGLRKMGKETFADIAGRYEALKKRVADTIIDSPAVMLNVPYGDSWFMPSAESYMARLISDAGGDYIYKKNTGNTSTPIDLEEAWMLASQADMWLNLDHMSSLEELAGKCPRFTNIRCFRNGDVFNNTRRANKAGGNDFYESGIVNPDIMLRDLVKIFHPELVEDSLVYYKVLL